MIFVYDETVENCIVLKEIRRAHKGQPDLKQSLTTFRRIFKDLRDLTCAGNCLPGLGSSLVCYFKGPDMQDIFGVRCSEKWSSAVKSQKVLSKVLFQKSPKEYHSWKPRKTFSSSQKNGFGKYQKSSSKK